MAPQQAGLAMVPTSLTGFVVSPARCCRGCCAPSAPQRTLVIGLVILAAGHLWLAHAPRTDGYLVAVLPGLLLVAIGRRAQLHAHHHGHRLVGAGDAHAGLASGLAGSADPGRRGARHGDVHRHRHLRWRQRHGSGGSAQAGFAAAFTAAAVVALATEKRNMSCSIGSTSMSAKPASRA